MRLISGPVGATYVKIGSDISTAIDKQGIRFLVTLGKGSHSNIKDILALRGIDMGIVQTDVLEEAVILNDNSELIYSNQDIRDNLCYVSKLYPEEMHILSIEENPKTKNSINHVSELENLNVSIGKQDSGTYTTALKVLSNAGITEKNTNLIHHLSFSDALDRLEKTAIGDIEDTKNEIHAVILVAGKQVSEILNIEKLSGLKFVGIKDTSPYDTDNSLYDVATIDSFDYPNIFDRDVPKEQNDESVTTISVMSALIMYNWSAIKNRDNSQKQRLKKTKVAIKDFMTALKILKKGENQFHKKWKEVEINSELEGWNRCIPAHEWIHGDNN